MRIPMGWVAVGDRVGVRARVRLAYCRSEETMAHGMPGRHSHSEALFDGLNVVVCSPTGLATLEAPRLHHLGRIKASEGGA